jgi:succinate dehydrogenase/fumarate reductase flavoprotein subunit
LWSPYKSLRKEKTTVNFERRETKEVDVLVIGAGIAGLEAAYAACRSGLTVAILSKGASASPGVLGFNAVVAETDSAARFYDDIRRGGWEINDPELVRVLVAGSSEAVRRLETLGLEFDKKADQTEAYHLLQPLGCSVARLVHSGNRTGRRAMELLTAALVAREVAVWGHQMALSLLIEDGRVVGIIALDTKTGVILTVAAKAVVLATGGGHLAQGSTYPDCLTGDGYALAYQAGAELIDLEFIQHEPCHGIYPRPLGISTTLLAGGGVLTRPKAQRLKICWLG